MGLECKMLGVCGFFAKYQEVKNLACKGFIRNYCKGSEMANCKRKRYRQEHGIAPSDDMMPNGQLIVGR